MDMKLGYVVVAALHHRIRTATAAPVVMVMNTGTAGAGDSALPRSSMSKAPDKGLSLIVAGRVKRGRPGCERADSCCLQQLQPQTCIQTKITGQ